MAKCEQWAMEEVDVLRHLPKKILREILMTADCITLRKNQKVLRLGGQVTESAPHLILTEILRILT